MRNFHKLLSTAAAGFSREKRWEWWVTEWPDWDIIYKKKYFYYGIKSQKWSLFVIIKVTTPYPSQIDHFLANKRLNKEWSLLL